jgi:hypothetical protein
MIMFMRKSMRIGAILILLGSICLFFISPAVAQVAELQTETDFISPLSEAEMAEMGVAPQLSAEEGEAVFLRLLKNREEYSAQFDPNPPGEPYFGEIEEFGLETDLEDASAFMAGDEVGYPGNPADFKILVNRKNTRANAAGGSTLAEPAMVQRGLYMFAAGNLTHAEFSPDRGNSWFDRVLPGGPADAPNLWGDQYIVSDDSSKVIFHAALYLNSAFNDGVVRIFVRRTIQQAGYNCAYDIRPFNGTSLPDFPKLALTKRYLYLTTNNVGAAAYAQIARFPIEALANCASVSYDFYNQPFSTYGQRVWVPASGAQNSERMYWVQHDNSTTMRIFWWPESGTTIFNVTRSLPASNFTDANCASGANNVDWIQGGIPTGIYGFVHRVVMAPGANEGPGVLATFWNSNAVGDATQLHIRSAIFDLGTLNLIAQPHIFNNSYCYGYPDVTANQRGDLGISLARSGRPGGSNEAVNGRVAIDDEFTPGLGFFQTTFPIATGTHNPSRWGDYTSIKAYPSCEKWFTVATWALDGGTSLANVNSRTANFGRNQSLYCYDNWAGKKTKR